MFCCGWYGTELGSGQGRCVNAVQPVARVDAWTAGCVVSLFQSFTSALRRGGATTMSAYLDSAARAHAQLFSDLPLAEAYRLSSAEAERRGLPKVSKEMDLTYGDVPFEALRQIIHAANPRPGTLFYDLGSGCGRGVIAAALIHEFDCCVGIEVLSDLHGAAVEPARRYETLRSATPAELNAHRLGPCVFLNADLFNVNLADDANGRRQRRQEEDQTPAPDKAASLEVDHRDVLVFACCVTWNDDLLERLAAKLAVELPTCSFVLTVGKRLPAVVDLPPGPTGKDQGAVRFEERWRGAGAFEWGSELLYAHECVRLGVLAARRHRKAAGSGSSAKQTRS